MMVKKVNKIALVIKRIIDKFKKLTKEQILCLGVFVLSMLIIDNARIFGGLILFVWGVTLKNKIRE